MKDLIMSQMGFWSAFTMLFMFGVMGWFIYKMVKLSKQKPTPLDKED
jgi:hypothetical protein